MGHLGIKRTLQSARDCFYWPKIAVKPAITTMFYSCKCCQKRKTVPKPADHAPLASIYTSELM